MEKSTDKTKYIILFFISLAASALNIVCVVFLRSRFGIPLYLDTAFTMAATFYGGVFWGVLTGVLSNMALHSIYFYGWPYYLFTLCNVAVALVTALFIRWFPRELNIGVPTKPKSRSQTLQNLTEKAIVLILLSFTLCMVISVMGGLIATLIKYLQPPAPDTLDHPEINFKLALIRKGLPEIIAEIGSRIPVNVPDRLVSSFVGYGTALLLKKSVLHLISGHSSDPGGPAVS